MAINKIDKDNANPDRIMNQLSEHGLIPEEWGGDTLVARVSARTREGLDNLLETLNLQAEILELKANPERRAFGTVIESKLDRGRGAVSTVLVQRGTLRRGDAFVAGWFRIITSAVMMAVLLRKGPTSRWVWADRPR